MDNRNTTRPLCSRPLCRNIQARSSEMACGFFVRVCERASTGRRRAAGRSVLNGRLGVLSFASSTSRGKFPRGRECSLRAAVRKTCKAGGHPYPITVAPKKQIAILA